MDTLYICPSTLRPCKGKWCHGPEVCPIFFGKEEVTTVTRTTVTVEMKYSSEIFTKRFLKRK